MRRWAAAGALALGLLAVAPGARAAEPAPSDADILKAFAAIAFGEEGVVDPDPRLKKWLRPVRVFVEAEAPLTDVENAALDAHMARLGRLTGLALFAVRSPAHANYLLIFTDRAAFRARIEAHLDPARRFLLDKLAAAGCVGLFRALKDTHEIVEAVVIVPLDEVRARGRFGPCVREETTQVLGLPNDSSAVGATLFDDNGQARDLTALDVLLLRLLYHPRLAPGMTRDEALAAAREALPDLRRAP